MDEKQQGADGLSRRGVLKLAGAVAALGAGLGVTLEPASGAPEEAGRLQYKFYRIPDNGDESKAEVIFMGKFSPADERKILSVARGRLQLKMFAADTSQTSEEDPWHAKTARLLVKQVVPLDPAQVNFKMPAK